MKKIIYPIGNSKKRSSKTRFLPVHKKEKNSTLSMTGMIKQFRRNFGSRNLMKVLSFSWFFTPWPVGGRNV